MKGYRGLITATDPKEVKAKIALHDLDGIETGWLPVPQMWTHGAGAFHLPRVGQQAYAFFLDEEHIDGLILSGRYSDKDRPAADLSADDLYLGFEDGTAVHFAPSPDPQESLIATRTPGALTITAGKNIEIASAANISAAAKGSIALVAEEQSIAAKAKHEVRLESGLEVTIKAEGNVTVKGLDINLIAEAVTIKAPIIKLDGGVVITGTVSVGSATSPTFAVAKGAVSIATPLSVAGPITALDATLGGKLFSAHFHVAQGPASPTTVPG
jgi:phage baseplate assembly protein V